jgi:hypothetical protein
MSGPEIAAAISGLIKTVTLMQRSLLDLAGPAPMSFVELTNEFQTFRAALEAIGALASENGPFNSQHDLKGRLEREVKRAQPTFRNIQNLLDKYGDKVGPGASEPKRTLAKIKWAIKIEEVSKLLNELRTHNLRLGRLLNIAQMHVFLSLLCVVWR